MARNHVAVIALVAIVAATAGVLLARVSFDSGGPLPQKAMTAGTVLNPPRPMPEFALVSHDEKPFTRERLRDRWSLLFFGFTNCPDVCPATLTVLAQMEKGFQDLPAEQRPQIILVSVDPERDTPQQLTSYVKFFSPSFVGLTGSKENIESFTQALGVPVAISKSSDGSYSVDHSASIFLIDP
ncbi:MAG TPA: SCO family protein, partial [Steroidobacteraceae bacterium]|nr:SCO family protein [Steroidobacteraceae bacterium]